MRHSVDAVSRQHTSARHICTIHYMQVPSSEHKYIKITYFQVIHQMASPLQKSPKWLTFGHFESDRPQNLIIPTTMVVYNTTFSFMKIMRNLFAQSCSKTDECTDRQTNKTNETEAITSPPCRGNMIETSTTLKIHKQAKCIIIFSLTVRTFRLIICGILITW